MPDLAERIAAAIDHAEQVAQAAADVWHGDAWEVQLGPDGWEVGVTKWPSEVVAQNPEEVVEHIALNDPAAVLRRCAADRRVLERHAPAPFPPFHIDGSLICAHDWADSDGSATDWPCDDIRDLADRWGVEVQA